MIELLKSDVGQFNLWRIANIHLRLDWSNIILRDMSILSAYLINMELPNADFSGSDLRGCFFSGSNLDSAGFRNCNLQKSCFGYAVEADEQLAIEAAPHLDHVSYLENADFTLADLTGASFQYAYLRKTIFSDAILKNTDFRFSDYEQAQFTGINKSDAIF